MRTEIIPAPTSEAPTSVAIAPSSIAMPTIATINGRAVAPNSARPRAFRRPSSRSHRIAEIPRTTSSSARKTAARARPLAREQAVEVEVHPRRDEVDRDQEAEPDALEPHPDGLAVGGVEREPHDEPGGERAEDEVEADVVREQHQRGERRAPTGAPPSAGRVDRFAGARAATAGGRARSAVAAQPRRRGRRGASRISSPAPYTPVRKTEMTTIGQNSPATPVPSTARRAASAAAPRRRGSGRASRARCASATPTTHHSASSPAAAGRRRRPADGERERPAGVPRRRTPGARASRRPRARRRRRGTRARSSRGTGVGVDLREVEHFGADQDPEHDLDHDRRQHDAGVMRDSSAPRLDARRTSAIERRSGATAWAATVELAGIRCRGSASSSPRTPPP